MASYIDPSFRESLLKKPQDRSAQDLTLINANLKSLEALSSLRDTTIRGLCKTVKYEKHEANDVLYRSGDVINCWYILLSGSVFIDGSMYLPRSGFGRRSAGQSMRVHDCLVLETSEMLVIDYPKQHLNDHNLTDTSLLNQVSNLSISSQHQHQNQNQKTFRQFIINEEKTELFTTTTTSLSQNVKTTLTTTQPSKQLLNSTNLTSFKHIANSSSNSPIIIMKLSDKNSEENEEESEVNIQSHEDQETVDDEIEHEENDLHNLNIIYTDNNEFDLNDSRCTQNRLDQDQIKSICIITGNSSFQKDHKSTSNKNHFHHHHHHHHNHSKHKSNRESLALDISQQTISSSTNINTSSNTIDTLDDDLNFNSNNQSSSMIQSIYTNNNNNTNLNNKHSKSSNLNLNTLESCSSSISSSKSSSIISSSNQGQQIMSVPLITTTNVNGSSNITASTSNSMNDDGSELSVQMAKDAVREVLEKDPKERNDEDIDVLFEFMQTLPAFSNLTEPITRKLCACMVLGVVEKTDTVVLDHNEKLDSWAVVLNGQVECTLPDSCIKTYHVGDHFGVSPVLDPVLHEGVMRTKCDDCQFVLVKQNDYYEILNKSKENTNNYYDGHKLVMITEFRPLNNSTDRTGEIVLKATPDKLIERLVNDESFSMLDPTFIQDFLLTYRVFIDQPTYISTKLFECFQKHSNFNSSSPNLLTANLAVKNKVYRIILGWITNHFNDFETNRDLYDFVDRFQDVLNKEKMSEQFRVLNIAISTKSKQRTVTLARSKRDETLMFSIQGGWEKGYGIFISKVDKETKAHELGVRKGDQIIEVNGHSFQHITLPNALESLKSFTHSSITLKYNPIGFNEMLLHPEKSPHRNKKNLNSNKAYLIEYIQQQQQEQDQHLQQQVQKPIESVDANPNLIVKKSIGSMPPLPPSVSTNNLTPRNKSKDNKAHFKLLQTTNLNPKDNSNSNSNSNQIRKFLGRLNRKAHSKDLESLSQVDSSAPSLKSITRSPSPSLSTFHSSTTCSSLTNSISGFSANNNKLLTTSVNLSRSNSSNNLSQNSNNNNDSSNQSQYDSSFAKMTLQDQNQFVGEHVLKIYKNDQTFKYLVVHKETSTKEVVMLALNEFNIVDDIGSNAYSLCEVSVDQDRLIKQKRLPDQLNNLAERLPLNARYYLKCITSPEQFLSDSQSVEELIKDSNITFLQLDPLEISAQLTLRDYCLFKSIESSEYIDYLFKQKTSKYGFSHLSKFSEMSNEEMFWVINEILHESNLMKRARIIKHFIQIAHVCKECKNFNSLLSIVSGLENFTVTRLKDTWEKVSLKYKKILQDLKMLLDPSFNMAKYRNLFKNETIQPPIIPFFPICQKDLYFLNESGDTLVDGLVNFEKLRKLSKSVRSIVQMTSSPFDLTSMRDVPTSHTVIFSMFGCTNPSLIEYRNGGASSHQFAKLNIKADHIKKLYEEVAEQFLQRLLSDKINAFTIKKKSVMVRKVRHYLNNMSKNIEINEQRLRLISSTLEHSTSGHTLKRKPSPNSSLGGSVSSINALNNSNNMHNISTGSSISAGNALAGISTGNGTLASHKNAATLFGTHSPDAVKKLLALSETKVKTVKNSSSSSSVPLSHLSNSRIILNTSSSSVANSNTSNSNGITSLSPTTPLSPKTKQRSISSSQPLNKYNYSIPLSNESSSVSSIKLNGSSNCTKTSNQQSGPNIKTNISNTIQNGSEADSGRASMASNVDQDQCSPTFQHRAFILNRYLTNDQQNQLKSINNKMPISKSQISVSNQEMLLNSVKLSNSNKNCHNSLEEEDQVSAV